MSPQWWEEKSQKRPSSPALLPQGGAQPHLSPQGWCCCVHCPWPGCSWWVRRGWDSQALLWGGCFAHQAANARFPSGLMRFPGWRRGEQGVRQGRWQSRGSLVTGNWGAQVWGRWGRAKCSLLDTPGSHQTGHHCQPVSGQGAAAAGHCQPLHAHHLLCVHLEASAWLGWAQAEVAGCGPSLSPGHSAGQI